MSSYSRMSRRGLYRSRNGAILGVCRGIADYFDLSVFWIRATAVILFICTGFWPIVGLYILAALLMKSDPTRPDPWAAIPSRELVAGIAAPEQMPPNV